MCRLQALNCREQHAIRGVLKECTDTCACGYDGVARINACAEKVMKPTNEQVVCGAGGEAEFEERAAGRAAADARAVVDTLRRARGRDYTSDSGASEAVRLLCLSLTASPALGR